jgi:hypothetical protein
MEGTKRLIETHEKKELCYYIELVITKILGLFRM